MTEQTYEMHTNRELEFVLRAFEPYVQSGKFVKRDYGRLWHVFYALPAEERRIDAFIAMLSVAAKTVWSEGFERLEGKLLGYEEWQTDIHLECFAPARMHSSFPGCESRMKGYQTHVGVSSEFTPHREGRGGKHTEH